MKRYLGCAGTLCALMGAVQAASAAAPSVHERTLNNGIRVAYLHVAGSPDFSILTFLPMGLAFDERDRAQWSHLIEHLVIRTTVPGRLTNVNAETLPDHMRLDYYGTREDWREGLSHHARWLNGLPFTEESIQTEPGRANSEADFAAKALATHKFAIAAWNQVCRCGKDHAGIKADLLRADRNALEDYRDARLVIPDRTLVCMIGGVEPDAVFTSAAEALADIEPAAKPGPGAPVKPGDHQATWDLDARHVLLTWPIPGPDKDVEAHASLLVLARLLLVRMAQDRHLRESLGPVLVGADLCCPESSYFYLSATCRPGTDASEASKRLADQVAAIAVAPRETLHVRQVSEQLIREFDVQDPDALRAQAPPSLKPGMIEAQLAVNWGTTAYRLGARRRDVTAALRTVTFEQVRKAAQEYLSADRCTSVALSP